MRTVGDGIIVNENILWRYEKKYPHMMFTESNDKSIAYVSSKEDDRIGIIIAKDLKVTQILLLTKEQAQAICEELPELTWMIGRGRKKGKVEMYDDHRIR